MSAKILPNKVYTNIKGSGFRFLDVGNNQSLRAVERTNGIEFQGVNGTYYINLFNKTSPDIPRYCVRISISSTASCSPNVSEELVILSLNKIGKTLLKSIKNERYIKFNSESKLLVYRIWFRADAHIDATPPQPPSGYTVSWMLHKHLQCVITTAMAEILTLSNRMISTAINVTHVVGLKWPHL